MNVEELNGLQSECRSYLVFSGEEALIVDPLLDRVGDYLGRLEARGLRLAFAADTHTHADHLSGVKALCRRTGARSAGAPRSVVSAPLGHGDWLVLGDERVTCWSSPGHTADSLAFVLPGHLLAGDTLFIGSTGRTDLPTGDPEAEWDSIQHLLTLPDATVVWPGHDYNGRLSSTIGEERRTNKRLLLGREAFLRAMREPRATKPALLDKALAYNANPHD